MNTPSDKPDLPALPLCFDGETNITRHLIQQFAWRAADEREAWARADERRKLKGHLDLWKQLTIDVLSERDSVRRKALEEAAAICDKSSLQPAIAARIRALIDRKEPT